MFETIRSWRFWLAVCIAMGLAIIFLLFTIGTVTEERDVWKNDSLSMRQLNAEMIARGCDNTASTTQVTADLVSDTIKGAKAAGQSANSTFQQGIGWVKKAKGILDILSG